MVTKTWGGEWSTENNYEHINPRVLPVTRLLCKTFNIPIVSLKQILKDIGASVFRNDSWDTKLSMIFGVNSWYPNAKDFIENNKIIQSCIQEEVSSYGIEYLGYNEKEIAKQKRVDEINSQPLIPHGFDRE